MSITFWRFHCEFFWKGPVPKSFYNCKPLQCQLCKYVSCSLPKSLVNINFPKINPFSWKSDIYENLLFSYTKKQHCYLISHSSTYQRVDGFESQMGHILVVWNSISQIQILHRCEVKSQVDMNVKSSQESLLGESICLRLERRHRPEIWL